MKQREVTLTTLLLEDRLSNFNLSLLRRLMPDVFQGQVLQTQIHQHQIIQRLNSGLVNHVLIRYVIHHDTENRYQQAAQVTNRYQHLIAIAILPPLFLLPPLPILLRLTPSNGAEHRARNGRRDVALPSSVADESAGDQARAARRNRLHGVLDPVRLGARLVVGGAAATPRPPLRRRHAARAVPRRRVVRRRRRHPARVHERRRAAVRRWHCPRLVARRRAAVAGWGAPSAARPRRRRVGFPVAGAEATTAWLVVAAGAGAAGAASGAAAGGAAVVVVVGTAVVAVLGGFVR